MNQLQVFNNTEFGQVRTMMIKGSPWFVAKDVCECLGIIKHRDAVSRLDGDERGSVEVDTLGGTQQMAAVNEYGLYNLVLSSRKPSAQKIEADKPKVLFADSVAASHGSILVGELAKLLNQNGIDIGQNRLFNWLRENGYLICRKGTDYNMPTQRSMEMQLFSIKETAITHSDGHVSISKTVKVTGKGQLYFVNKFLKGA